MHRLVIALLALGVLASGLALPAGAGVLASRAIAEAAENPTPPAELANPPQAAEDGDLVSREFALGALIVGSTFVLGLLAGGGTVTAIASAGAVLMIYTLMP